MNIPINAAVLMVPALVAIGIIIGALGMHWHYRYLADDLAVQRADIARWERSTSTDLFARLADPEPDDEDDDDPEPVIVPDMHDVYMPEDVPPPAPMPAGLATALAAAMALEALTWRHKRPGKHSGQTNAAGHALLLTLLTPTQQLRAIGSEVA
jgi:hypothetical protein